MTGPIALSRISKSFGPVRALDDVSLEIRPGDRLALVGENGAGKSSLMNVLYGLYRPDAGTITVNGAPVRIVRPRDAIALGIGMVHQHFMLVPSMSVAENVVLGHEPTRRGALAMDEACEAVLRTSERFGFALDPRAIVHTLSVGSQQKVEIVKALYRGAQTLILDEPTAVLTPQEADELFKVARNLTDAGHSVVFVSHKLKEVLAVATRIVVMRRGAKIAEVSPAEASVDSLAELMVGRAVPDQTQVQRAPVTSAKPCLEFVDVHATADDGRVALRGVSLTLAPGEIVGIAGVDGNGQRELAEVAVGLRETSGGEVRIGGERLSAASPAEAKRHGVAHIPEDRLLRAVVKEMSVEENLALGRHHLPPFARRGFLIDFAGRRERARRLIEAFDIRPPDERRRLADLSGGNQQKAVVARELDTKPRVVVAVQPTRGLDVAAVAAVRARLLEERARGCGVLLVSLDLDEVLALCDRVYVLFAGRVAGERTRDSFDERELGHLMLGGSEKRGPLVQA